VHDVKWIGNVSDMGHPISAPDMVVDRYEVFRCLHFSCVSDLEEAAEKSRV
jgi:hypothetical protein